LETYSGSELGETDCDDVGDADRDLTCFFIFVFGTFATDDLGDLGDGDGDEDDNCTVGVEEVDACDCGGDCVGDCSDGESSNTGSDEDEDV